MAKPYADFRIRKAIERWEEWGIWKYQEGEGYARPVGMTMATVGRGNLDMSNPVVDQVERMEWHRADSNRSMLAEKAFRGLGRNEARVIWLRYVELLPSLEAVATYITAERRAKAEIEITPIYEHEPATGQYVQVEFCQIPKAFTAYRARQSHDNACKWLAECMEEYNKLKYNQQDDVVNDRIMHNILRRELAMLKL